MTIPALGRAPSGRLPAGLAPVRTVLPNGVVVIAKETKAIPAVTINLAVRAGSICDPQDARGAVHLISKVIDRGTVNRSAADIAEDLDSRGITLSTSVTRHLLSLACTCLAEHFEPVCSLLGDVVMSPSFPEGELATRKAETITSIRQDEDDPAVRAVESLMGLLYPGGHPYGRLTKGTVDDVERLTRERLVQLYGARFAPSVISAVIVGDVPVGLATAVATRVFDRWRVPQPPPIAVPSVRPAIRRQRLVIPMMNKVQADIAYGFVTIPRADPAYYAFSLMNNVLGQYAMGGRLGDRIRERQGMAYYVFSSFDPSVGEGPLLVRAGVSPANVDRTVASIDEEIGRIARDGVTAKELAESQQYLVGSMPRALETNAGIANFLQTSESFGLGLDYDVRLPDLLCAVTLDDVHAAARRVLDPACATIVIAGPYEDHGMG